MNTPVPTLSVAERTQARSLVFKTLAKRIAATLRSGLPGVITAFDPATQKASIQLAIVERIINATGGFTPTSLPILQDVLVLFPGDAQWCLTFPNLVGTECYVCFADMCVNAWKTHGMQQDSNGKYVPVAEEIPRRHDLSDGFAILCPRSQPNAIANYSTNAVELRSMDGNTKISMDANGNIVINSSNSSGGISITGAGNTSITSSGDTSINSNGNILIKASGTLTLEGDATGAGLEFAGTSGVIQTGTTQSKNAIPILIDGVTWYVRLSELP